MYNNLTIGDVKESIEYRWLRHRILCFVMAWLIIALVSIIPLIIVHVHYWDYAVRGFWIWMLTSIVLGFVFLSLSVPYIRKITYFKKHYKDYKVYNVFLEKVNPAYGMEISFTVTIDEGRKEYEVPTSPCFSNNIGAIFSVEEYINCEVVGIYDTDLQRFYIIRKKF